ncbi:hypothetical protein ACOQFV_24150 [Nocardiopsis changdeensis]|uniref:DUF222 domain-containing protein n=1 Tax=Nocardiopsis changdeensis TaxID=2831969 RepID=A0A975QCD0_9ACTN|nr:MULTISPECIES: hypothetical protein [Nocardiopsis]QUX26513.1 hypothetical protein KGD84_32975 [Nocardiopsis changdeensis]QYX40785.1 hypothetical protein K1J57_32825 [Nocardiopsis sp. MT53]
MALHNTPVQLDTPTLVDQRPRERFADAATRPDPQVRDRAQAMVVMEVWDAALGPDPAPIAADTLGITPERVDQLKQVGQDWLWQAVVNPPIEVLVGGRRTELAEALEDEDMGALADRIRRQRLGDGQYVALTLRELDSIRPVVEAIPEMYAVRDRLVPLVRSAWWDAAAEQHRRFHADRAAMDQATSPRAWADLYGYQRACTALEQVLAHGKKPYPAPYLGDGSETVATADRLGELDRAVRKQEHRFMTSKERDRADGWVMPRDTREALDARPGTWRWGQASA